LFDQDCPKGISSILQLGSKAYPSVTFKASRGVFGIAEHFALVEHLNLFAT
jgi:hypothetical protein